MTVFEESMACEHAVDSRFHKAKQHELRTNKGIRLRRPTREDYAPIEDPYAFAAAALLPISAYYTQTWT